MKVGTEGTVVVRKNPGYNPKLTKEYLVLNAGTCVGEFDSKAEAETYCAKIIGELPKHEDSGLSYRQQLQYAYRSTPKKEVSKRRELKNELQLIKAQEAQQSGKTRRALKKGLDAAKKGQLVPAREDYSKYVKNGKSPLTEAFEILLPKAKTFHYHKKSSSHPGRRGRCTCKEGVV